MKELIKNLWFGEEGGDLSEYALLIALVSLVVMVAIMGSRTAAGHP